jgi:lysophospholipase L1-like esterase
MSSDAGATGGWSSIGFKANFTGTSATLQIDDSSQNIFQYSVDNGSFTTVGPSVGATIPLATGLASGNHSVQFWRLTEGSFGDTTIHGLTLDTGASLLPPDPRPPHKIEVLGDSISAGLGDLSPANGPANYDGPAEDGYQAYGPQIARMLNAEWSVIAHSGVGVTRVACESYTGDTMPQEFMYTECPYMNPGATMWNFSQWQPDVLIITLGTNDWVNSYCMSVALPSDSDFEMGYEALLMEARTAYPNAEIFALGTFLSSAAGPQWPECSMDIQTSVMHRNDSHMHAVDPSTWLDPATDFIGDETHPTVAGHTKIANNLAPIIKQTLGW